jgi:hypothetical protein
MESTAALAGAFLERLPSSPSTVEADINSDAGAFQILASSILARPIRYWNKLAGRRP